MKKVNKPTFRKVRLNFTNKKGQSFNLVEEFDSRVTNEEIGATLVARFLRGYKTYRNFQASNKGMGFNFAQKFNIKLIVDSKELTSTTWDNMDVNGNKVDLSITLVNREQRVEAFLNKMEILILDLFDCVTLKVKTFDEAKKLFEPQLN